MMLTPGPKRASKEHNNNTLRIAVSLEGCQCRCVAAPLLAFVLAFAKHPPQTFTITCAMSTRCGNGSGGRRVDVTHRLFKKYGEWGACKEVPS